MGAWKRWRRARTLRRHPLSAAEWQEALGDVPLTRTLAGAELDRLRELATLFVRENDFAGVRGFVLTPRHARAIAIQACLPVLELGLDAYGGSHSIVVYPGEFRTDRRWEDEHGIVHVDRDPQSGEAWPEGPVVLSWADVAESAEHPFDGYNVVIHEFAHKLDMRGGDANGTPPLHRDMDAGTWQRAFAGAYAHHCAQVDAAVETALDEYAAESPGEFFAVMSEYFFEAPDLLHREYPDVYGQLRLYYRQDPLRRLERVPPDELDASG
ncbi:MAG: zinc-dependent peptidase [Planctomycetes bacterium]|nr:zinc-dependent peptidase [Planctomycetota bacterium]